MYRWGGPLVKELFLKNTNFFLLLPIFCLYKDRSDMSDTLLPNDISLRSSCHLYKLIYQLPISEFMYSWPMNFMGLPAYYSRMIFDYLLKHRSQDKDKRGGQFVSVSGTQVCFIFKRWHFSLKSSVETVNLKQFWFTVSGVQWVWWICCLKFCLQKVVSCDKVVVFLSHKQCSPLQHTKPNKRIKAVCLEDFFKSLRFVPNSQSVWSINIF